MRGAMGESLQPNQPNTHCITSRLAQVSGCNVDAIKHLRKHHSSYLPLFQVLTYPGAVVRLASSHQSAPRGPKPYSRIVNRQNVFGKIRIISYGFLRSRPLVQRRWPSALDTPISKIDLLNTHPQKLNRAYG